MERDEKQELKTKVREAANGEWMGRNEQMRTVSAACSACMSLWGDNTARALENTSHITPNRWVNKGHLTQAGRSLS